MNPAYSLGDIIVKLKADTTNLERGLAQASASTDSLGSKMAGLGKVVAIGMAAAVAATAAFGAISVKAYAENEAVMAQVNQVLKTTGKVSQISGAQVESLAMSMEKYSGKAHDAILQGQTILLQFSQTTSKNLPEMTKAMLDLSQRMGIDTVTAAKSLGIALDDPATGMARLRRAGIDFTASQKEAIKTLQASGDISGADALLMKSLEDRVGGAAGAYRNTLSGSIASARNSLKDMEITIGGTISQYLEPLAASAAKALQNVDWQKVANRTVEVLKVLGQIIKDTIVAIVDLTKFITQHKLILAILAGIIGTVLVAAFVAWTIAAGEAAIATLAAIWPILAIGAAVGLVAFLLIRYWTDIKQAFVVAGEVIAGVVSGIISWFDNLPVYAAQAVNAVISWFEGLPGRILKALGSLAGLLYDAGVDLIQGMINGVVDGLKKLIGAVKNAVGGVISGIKGFLGIHSPSEVFADIGRNMGAGMAQGIDQSLPRVLGSAQKLSIGAAVSTVNTRNTSITGPININSPQDADYFFRRLDRNNILESKGLSPA